MTFTKLLTINSAALIVAIVAWVLNVQQLYWMAGVLFLLPFGSRWFARLELRGVEVERRLPGAGNQGEMAPVSLRVRNESPLPKLYLSVADDLPPALRPDSAGSLPVHAPPRGEDTVTYHVTLLRRGVHEIPSVRIQASDPLGLSDVSRAIPESTRILVYPRVVDLPEWLQPREAGGGYAPLDVSRRQGEGSSFWGLREYRPGDSPRHVHWRTAARLGRLTVMEWEAEASRSLVLAVDPVPGSERPLPDRSDGATPLDVAAGVAASLAALFSRADQSLRLVAPGVTPAHAPVQQGAEAMSAVLDALARLRVMEGGDTASSALRILAPQLEMGTTICWVTPAVTSEALATIQFLAAAGMCPVLYLIDAPDAAPENDSAVSRMEQLQVPVFRVATNDEFARQLLG